MSYFPDLSPYDYGKGFHPGVVHVGWLDGHHDYPKGSVPREIVNKLRVLATRPVELYMGLHVCELCPLPNHLEEAAFSDSPELMQMLLEWERPRSSNGEIRVTLNGVTYAAPVLIVHNIEEHGYLPPKVFLEAVVKGTVITRSDTSSLPPPWFPA
jgi:hypothetical protein